MRDQTWAPGSAAVVDTILRRGGPAISAEAKLVYLALFSYMGTDFTSRPSVATLAEGTSLSERTVQRVLKDLEAVRLVIRVPRFDAEGRRTATLYRMTPPWGVSSPLTSQGGEGDSVTPPPDKETPPSVPEAPAPDSVTQDRRQGDTVPPSESHRPGDTVTPKVTHSEVTHQKNHEEGAGAGKVPAALHPEAVSWRKWFERKTAGRWPRSDGASVLDTAAADGMSHEVIIKAIEAGIAQRVFDPISWAASKVGNMFAAGVRTLDEAEEYERTQAAQEAANGKAGKQRYGSKATGRRADLARADGPRSKWEAGD